MSVTAVAPKRHDYGQPETPGGNSSDPGDAAVAGLACSEGRLPATVARRVALPAHCSRFDHAPEDCLAVVVDGVLSRTECEALIRRWDPHVK